MKLVGWLNGSENLWVWGKGLSGPTNVLGVSIQGDKED